MSIDRKKFIDNLNITFGIIGSILSIISLIYLFISQGVLIRIIVVIVALVTIILVVFFLTIIQERKKDNIKRGFVGDNSVIIKEIKKYLLNMFNNREYNDVCNYGIVFSRIFYIASAHKSRIEIERIILKSAEYLGREKICANSLLNIGWTIILLNYDFIETFEYKGSILKNSLDYINEGIKIAQKIGMNTIIAKGYSHLSGYYLCVGDFIEAYHMREKVNEYVELIQDGQDKKVLLAGLLYNDAETAFLRKEYNTSKTLSINADNLRKDLSEEDREVRHFAQIGKIEYMIGDLKSAKDLFTIGMDKAKKIKRVDEIVKNTYGYALCLIREGQKNQAVNTIKDVTKEYGSVPLFISDCFFYKEYYHLLGNTAITKGGYRNGLGRYL